MELEEKTILVTGAAGFIGFHLARRLLGMGARVVGLDNLNPYYDVRLKQDRLKLLESAGGFDFVAADLQDLRAVERVFHEHRPSIVCNLAAQAGVRHSLKDPFSYQKSNLEGFLNLLEMARNDGVENFVYASSSSVYGGNDKVPFSVEDRVDAPVSLYAATKRANELMAHAYSHLFGIPCTGLRYFTVYGPWGRPDMALFLFARAILRGEPITVYNYGRMKRDFTYVDDAVDGTVAALKRPAPYEIFNLGNADWVTLMDFIGILEEELGKTAEKDFQPIQPGDVRETAADIEKSRVLLGFHPKTPLREGIRRFLTWYRDYYHV
jgi:UDP-glucuronate 4-epimerase